MQNPAIIPSIYEFVKLKPSLGLFWSNSVNTRIFLTRTQQTIHMPFIRRAATHTTLPISPLEPKQKVTVSSAKASPSPSPKGKSEKKLDIEVCVRRASILLSPRLPISSRLFLITPDGIESYGPH